MSDRKVYGFCDAGCKYPVVEEDASYGQTVRFVNNGLQTVDGEFVELAQSAIVRGSYVGNGTYGKNNPNVLTFERPVKMLILLPAEDEDNDELPNHILYKPNGIVSSGSTYRSNYDLNTPLPLFGTKYVAQTNGHIYVTKFDTEVSWYAENNGYLQPSGDVQRNISGVTYEYIAFLT